jgi:hypothetical protein
VGVCKAEAIRNGSPSGEELLLFPTSLVLQQFAPAKPPELLSQILLHLEELSKDAWPETQDAAEEDWQRRWHSGMDVDGL